MNALDWQAMSRAEQDAYVDHWYREMRPRLVEQALAAGMWPQLVEYLEKGGAMHFSFHEVGSDGISTPQDAIERHFATLPLFDFGPLFRVTFDRAALEKIEPTVLSKATFLGRNYDAVSGRISEGMPHHRPGAPVGEFVAAFVSPPHRVSMPIAELQALFDQLVECLSLDDPLTVILDWASQQLAQISDYYDAGFEWWGAFLWTVEASDKSRIAVISASATD